MYETEHDRNSDKHRQQVGADLVLFDQSVSNGAHIQIFMWTICTKVEVRITVLDQVKGRAGLASIEAQVQMRTADTRQ
jgi:hypothetical protein